MFSSLVKVIPATTKKKITPEMQSNVMELFVSQLRKHLNSETQVRKLEKEYWNGLEASSSDD